MQSANTSASTKGLFLYLMESGSSSRTSVLTKPKKTSSVFSSPHLLDIFTDGSDSTVPTTNESKNCAKADPVEGEPVSSNTINSQVNLKELYKLKRSIQYCLFIAICGFIFGFDIGTIGGLVNFPSFRAKFSPNGVSFNRLMLGMIIGVSSICSCASGLISNFLTTQYGRKPTIIIALILYGLGDVILMTSETWIQVVIGRMFNGTAIGISAVTAPLFIGELPQSKLRGSLISVLQLMTTLGIFLGSIVLYFAKSLSGQWQYQAPVAFSLFVCNAGGLIIGTIPESPVYLLQKGLAEEAVEVVADLNGLSKDHWFVQKQISEMIENVEENKKSLETDKRELTATKRWFQDPDLFTRVIVGSLIMVFQQFTGINYFFFYGTTIFRNAGLRDLYVTSIILSSVNLVFSVISIFTTDRFGRRSLLMLGSLVMFACMSGFAIAGSFFLSARERESVGIIMIVFTCIFIAAFTTSWGPVSFLVVNELLPYRFKAKGMSIASSVNWVSTFLISFCSPYVSQLIGFKSGFFFALCLFASGLFVFCFVPETRGKDVQAIEAIYENGKSFIFSAKKTVVRDKAVDACRSRDGPTAEGSGNDIEMIEMGSATGPGYKQNPFH